MSTKMIQSSNARGKRSLFKEKVVVCRIEAIEEVNADCFVNFCCPNILTGTTFFACLHQMAGPDLALECQKFADACPTSSRVTPAYEAENFKFIVHTIVPTPLDLSRIIDIKKVYVCVRNSLDLAIEEGANTIAFPSYFPGLSSRIAAELILRVFTVWIHRNQCSDQLKELKICCQNEREFHMFVQAARTLYEEANVIGHMFVPAFVQQRQAYYQRMSRPRRYRRLFDPPPHNAPQVKLELSAKLAPTILVIDDENGMKRQYRLTNKSRDGRKLYFRCSRCDTLIKKDGVQIRAKLIVEDGQIVSERFPRHHPECEAKPLEKVLIQQVDRTSRREVRDGYLLPQDAYKKALDRMRFEARQLGIPVEECFPEWPKLRQQYCRIRKQAVRQRQQEKWERMVMGRAMGQWDESQFDADMDDYYQFQTQRPRRGRPPKNAAAAAASSAAFANMPEDAFYPSRMRLAHDEVVISYDDDDDRDEVVDEYAATAPELLNCGGSTRRRAKGHFLRASNSRIADEEEEPGEEEEDVLINVDEEGDDRIIHPTEEEEMMEEEA